MIKLNKDWKVQRLDSNVNKKERSSFGVKSRSAEESGVENGKQVAFTLDSRFLSSVSIHLSLNKK